MYHQPSEHQIGNLHTEKLVLKHLFLQTDREITYTTLSLS